MHTTKFRNASILVLTLWVLSLLAFFAAGLRHSIGGQVHFAGHLQNRLKAYYLAKAGVEKAVIELAKDDISDYESLNESWANNEEIFKEAPLGGGYLTLSYRTACVNQSKEQDEEIILYGIMDESSKININKASFEILQLLLERIGGMDNEEAIDAARSIIDWRDIDNIVSPGGAEDDYYKSLDSPYECKDEKFQIPEELLLVRGMTPAAFLKIKNIITVYGEGRVNINTTGHLVLYALGMSEELAEKVIDYRRGSDGKDGTEDDNVFETVGGLGNIGFLFTEESVAVNNLISSNALSVKSNIFRVNSTGILKKTKGQVERKIICVLKRQEDKDPEILYWHE